MVIENWLDQLIATPKPGYLWCTACNKGGNCATCEGTCYLLDGDKCPTCHSAGRCTACNGEGVISLA